MKYKNLDDLINDFADLPEIVNETDKVIPKDVHFANCVVCGHRFAYNPEKVTYSQAKYCSYGCLQHDAG